MKNGSGEGSPSGGDRDFPCRIVVEGDSAVIMAELHGVNEEMIRIDLEGRTLIISADGRDQKYRSEISLP